MGSWQVVNQSGSLRSTDSTNFLHNLRSQNANMQESNATLVEDDIFTLNHNAVFMYLFSFLAPKIQILRWLILVIFFFFFSQLVVAVIGCSRCEALSINASANPLVFDTKMAPNYR